MRTTTNRAGRALPILCALLLLAASAPARSASSCTFQAAPAGITFPALDPSVATVVTAFTDVAIKCTGAGVPPPSGWAFVGQNGAYPNLRMKHSSLTAFIPYSVGNPPALVSSAGANQTYRVTATILPADYANAYAGAYSDLLQMTVLP